MRRQHLTLDQYAAGVLAGDRAILGRAITLVESDAPAHRAEAQALLRILLPESGKAIRVGITGVPGVGKSTLIETLGMWLCSQGHRVAVLAVDPSSSVTRGSIMGDKTRMEELSRCERAFIRPSPTGGAMGGVTRKTRETIIVCEAAGYDIILVETVGVGQSEVVVRSMTDCFMLLALAGAGDELQAIKKGVVELADMIAVTKADGENRVRALAARADYMQALRYLTPASEGWRPKVLTCSAQTGDGIQELWQTVEAFQQHGKQTGSLAARRSQQAQSWMEAMIRDELLNRFSMHPGVVHQRSEIEQAVRNQAITPAAGAQALLDIFDAPDNTGD